MRRFNFSVSYNGQTITKTVVAKGMRQAFNRARAAIANENYKAAFHGDYSCNVS
jgi:hypothetical protein